MVVETQLRRCKWLQGQEEWPRELSKSEKTTVSDEIETIKPANLFHKFHNLLLCCIACNEVIKISDNVHTDATSEIILWCAESTSDETGEDDESSLHYCSNDNK